MFRKMRRNGQLLSEQDTLAILENGTSGVLALAGDEGYPYAVPLSYVFAEGKLFFHGALSGHKADAIARCDKASFCVVAQDQVVPEKYTTHFVSAIAFGRVRMLTDPQEKRRALWLMAEKYNPGQQAAHDAEILPALERTAVIELSIEHLTGKECIELTRMRGGHHS